MKKPPVFLDAFITTLVVSSTSNDISNQDHDDQNSQSNAYGYGHDVIRLVFTVQWSLN